MTHEKQRIAIGKICGWFVAPKHWEHNGNLYPDIDTWIDPRFRDFDFMPAGQMVGSLPPYYMRSLDAMHEAEESLTELQVCVYDMELCKVVMRDWSTKAPLLESMDWHATASQRAEAFLRALNLWDEPTS